MKALILVALIGALASPAQGATRCGESYRKWHEQEFRELSRMHAKCQHMMLNKRRIHDEKYWHKCCLMYESVMARSHNFQKEFLTGNWN